MQHVALTCRALLQAVHEMEDKAIMVCGYYAARKYSARCHCHRPRQQPYALVLEDCDPDLTKKILATAHGIKQLFISFWRTGFFPYELFILPESTLTRPALRGKREAGTAWEAHLS